MPYAAEPQPRGAVFKRRLDVLIYWLIISKMQRLTVNNRLLINVHRAAAAESLFDTKNIII